MNTGFFGKVLWVNLTEEIFQEKLIDKKVYQNYLGGYGLAVKLIYEAMSSGLDPHKQISKGFQATIWVEEG